MEIIILWITGIISKRPLTVEPPFQIKWKLDTEAQRVKR